MDLYYQVPNWLGVLLPYAAFVESRYLGPVKMPEGTQLHLSPLVSSDLVWLQVFHELEHPDVVRYQVVHHK